MSHKEKITQVVNELDYEFIIIEALGDYTGAKKLIEKYRHVFPEMQICLDKLEDVQVEIRPLFNVK